MGYDSSRFVKEVDEEFICPICAMVLENGVQSQHCEHTFCENCIKEWLSVNKSCPVDRKELNVNDIKPISRPFQNLLQKLEIKCDFEIQGCDSIVKLENLQNHAKTCIFNPNVKIRCNKECGLEISQIEIDSHNCLSHLASVLTAQQKQINQLENELIELRKRTLWFSPNGLIVIQNTIECRNKPLGKDLFGLAQYNYPLNENDAYFEIKIIDLGDNSSFSSFIALTQNRLTQTDSDKPKLNVEYNGTSGTVYMYVPKIKPTEREIVPKWAKGDTIGCGIKFSKQSVALNDEVIVYFTRNKITVWEKSVNRFDIEMYPSFYTNSIGAKILITIT